MFKDNADCVISPSAFHIGTFIMLKTFSLLLDLLYFTYNFCSENIFFCLFQILPNKTKKSLVQVINTMWIILYIWIISPTRMYIQMNAPYVQANKSTSLYTNRQTLQRRRAETKRCHRSSTNQWERVSLSLRWKRRSVNLTRITPHYHILIALPADQSNLAITNTNGLLFRWSILVDHQFFSKRPSAWLWFWTIDY